MWYLAITYTVWSHVIEFVSFGNVKNMYNTCRCVDADKCWKFQHCGKGKSEHQKSNYRKSIYKGQ